MSEDIKNEEQKEDAVNSNLITCPCCGKLTLEKPLKLKGTLVDQWLACLLSATPFTHTYPVYGGKAMITVTQLSSQVEDDLTSFRSLLDSLASQKWGEDGRPECPVNLDHLKGAIHAYSHITDIEVSISGTSRLFKPSEAVWASYERLKTLKGSILDGTLLDKDVENTLEVLKDGFNIMFNPASVSSFPFAMLMAVVETHNKLVLTLMDNGFDSNFWQGIELG